MNTQPETIRRFLNTIFEVPRTGAPLWKRVVLVEIGLIVCGFAFAIMPQAAIGLDPWDAFHLGLSKATGVSIGIVVVIVGFAVMFLWIFLKQKLGIGTILNAITIGISIDFFITLIPKAPDFWWGLGYFIVAILINGLGISMYIGGGIGPGPRDGLMTGLVRITQRPLWLVRTAIEVVVLGLGWIMGGTVGLGTVIYAFSIGPVVHVMLPWFNLDKVKEPEDLEGHQAEAIHSSFIGCSVRLWTMKRLSVFPALFAMVTVAFLFGLAPVFHAVCVSAMSSSSTADMSHVMADGTVMVTTAKAPSAVINMSSSGTEVMADAISNPDMTASNVVGSIMNTAGLTLLTFFGLRYCKQALARGFVVEIPKPMLVKLSEVSLARARPPNHVDLNSLCISRT